MKQFVIMETGRDAILGCQIGRGSYVKVKINNRRYIDGEIKFDGDKGENQLYIYQGCIVVKAHYTNNDKLETKMRNEAEMVEDGEEVEITIIKEVANNIELISRKIYTVKVKGDYSDCADLIEK